MPHTSPETEARSDGNAPLVVVLLGPTASGKTALALELAERFALEIINVDSRQLYRGMNVGTAKPSPAQQARIRHHLLDLPLRLRHTPGQLTGRTDEGTAVFNSLWDGSCQDQI